MQVGASSSAVTTWAGYQSLLAWSQGNATPSSGANSAGSLARVDTTSLSGDAYGFTAAERARIRAATGAEVGPDGMIDFTTGAAVGRNTGRIPEGCTLASICYFNAGTVTFYGAVGPGEQAAVPSQHADLPRGTLTGMQLQFNDDASASDRAMLLNSGLRYVHALNVGEDKNWSPHAIFPGTTVAEDAAQRSSTQWGSSVLDRSL